MLILDIDCISLMMKVGYECSLMKDLKIKYSYAYKLRLQQLDEEHKINLHDSESSA